MLPGLGVTEILALGILALLVVGPKDLPLMMRKIGRFTARLRGMAQEFRTGFDELARQAELDELKREVDALRRANPLNDLRRPLQDLDRDLRQSVAPAHAPAQAKPKAAAGPLPPLPPDPGAPNSGPQEAEAAMPTPVEAPLPKAASSGGAA